ncbi:hypothetical protein [Moraxella boevrei]|uniref:hypothetical protein n=1 Tax=Faucicola boevrei TaxID=346665 RepID=UPI00373570AF
MNKHQEYALRNYRDVKYDDEHYNCLHFACDVYKDLTNQDLSIFVDELMTGKDKRKINPQKLNQLKKLDEPDSPCLTVMHGNEPHAGVYVDNFVLHLNENGVHIMPLHLIKLQYGLVSFYVKR